MTSLPTMYLVFNESIVILAGLSTGVPLRYAIVRGRGDAVNAWRVAHSVLIMDGLLMLGVGLAVPHLVLDPLSVGVMVWSFVASGYGFVLAFTIGAWKGLRSLMAKPYGLSTLLFGAHMIGAFGSLIGIAITVYGSLKAIL